MGRRQRSLVSLVVVVAAIGALSGCRAPDREPRTILVVSVDTLRADRLGCYGHPGGLTPRLDRLAADGVVFEDATAPTPITLPSHTSLFTGRYPTAHGVRNNGTFVVPEDEVTLAETLRDAGWNTAAVVASFPLKRRFGLGQGFRIYDDDIEPPRGARAAGMRVHFVERDASAVTDRALQVWAAMGEGPRFLWVHYFDPHAPYEPPPPYLGRHESPYDDEVAFADAEIGRLLDAVLGADPDAVVLVVSDHGEGLGEHGEANHGLFLYQTTLRVPMILRAPRVFERGARVPTPVSLVDAMPTLLGLVGLPAPPGLDGADLAPVAAGGAAPDRPVYAETHLPELEYRFSRMEVLRRGSLKYVEAPRPELFDVVADPGEVRNLVEEGAPDAERLAERLAEFLAEAEAGASGRASAVLDAEAEERLRSLGYVAAGAPDLPEGERGRDPKAMVGYFAMHGEANMALAEGRYDDGIAILRKMEAQAPENFMIHHHIGSALLAAGRNAEAEREFETVVRSAPDFYTGYRLLATAQANQGDVARAVASYRAAADTMPGVGRPFSEMGAMLESFGRFEEAAEAYREAISIEPDEPDYSRRLAELRLQRGDVDRLLEELEGLAASHPGSAALWTRLAIAARRAGDPAAALAHLQRALEIEPYRYEALVEVGEIQLSAGRADLAEVAFRRASESDPDGIEARFGTAWALWSTGRAGDALEAVDEVLRIDARHAPAYTLRGLCLESTGDVEAAAAALRQALQLNPADRRAREALTRMAAAR